MIPDEFARTPQLFQVRATIDHNETTFLCKHSFHDRFILFSFQRACGVKQPPTGNEQRQRGLQDRDLTLLQVEQVVRREAPLYFRITRERAGARTWNISKDAIESRVAR